jgi:hypothetical protein
MSVKIMGLVWDLDNSVIDREEKYVLLAYADHADHEGRNMFPSIDLICQKTGYKERAAQMITRSLVAKGFLIPDGKGPKGTNKWRYGGGAKNAGVQKSEGGGASSTVDGGATANAPESSKPSSFKPSKSATPRANDFPSNVLFREVTERYPSKANWHDVLKFVDGVSRRLGREPVKDDLLPFYSAWCAMGWNSNSINWLEYAVKGTFPGKQTPAPAGASVAQSWLARKEQEAQNVRA